MKRDGGHVVVPLEARKAYHVRIGGLKAANMVAQAMEAPGAGQIDQT